MADTLTPRLAVAGADLERVTFLTEIEEPDGSHRPLSLPDDLPVLERVVLDTAALTVIADPLFGYLGNGTDAGRDHSTRRALIPIVKLAARLGVTVWATRHLNKSGGGRAMYRAGESIAFIASSRIALIAGPDPRDEGRKVLAVTKCNIAARAPTIAFRLLPKDDVVAVAWEGVVEVTADGVIATADPGQRGQAADADAFLTEALADGAWHDSAAVKREGPRRALRRSRFAPRVSASRSRSTARDAATGTSLCGAFHRAEGRRERPLPTVPGTAARGGGDGAAARPCR